ncbi:GH25 family lysozyme [Terrisporobacter sp.]
MKKITQSILAVSLSASMIFPNMALISNAEEANTNGIENNSYINNTNDSTDQPNVEITQLTNPNAIGLGTITAYSLNVRSGPSTSYEVLGLLSKDTKVDILGRENNWYKISANNLIGYISASYVTLSAIEKGIDVSKWNGNIDWNQVKADGNDYVIIRAGFGSSTVDPQFKSYIEGASNAGLKIGIYWFSYATSVEKAKKEAAKCLATIEPYKDKISYPVFYDYEYDSVDYAKKVGVTITKDLSSKMAEAFLSDVASKGYITGIYANKDFGDRYFNSDILYANNLWIAQYSSPCTYNKPYMMWQYTEEGIIDGIGTLSKPNYFDKNYTYLKPTNNIIPESKIDVSLISVNDIKSVTYTGSDIKPSVTLTLNNENLKESEDYTLTYSDNIDVGTGKVTITGINRYTGTKTVPFEITPKDDNSHGDDVDNNISESKIDVSSASVNDIKSLKYTGSNVNPGVTVTLNDKILKENEDYTLTYSDNTSVGMGKVTITGINEYTGTKAVSFKIIPKTVSNISLDKKTTNSISFSWDKIDDVTGYKIYKYDEASKSYKHLKTIKDNNINTYTNKNLNSSSIYNYKIRAYKVIDGTTYYGKYSSIFTASTNSNIDLSLASVNDIKSVKYTGSDIKPSVTLTLNDKTLKENEDYTLTYSDNISAGIGKITITGINEYTGTKTVSFKIIPKTVSNILLNKKTTDSISFSWDKIDDVTGYKIYKYDNTTKSYKHLKTIKGNNINTYTDSNLNCASTYSYKIRAYKSIDGTTYYGKYSSIFTASTEVNKVTNLKLDTRKITSLKISWDKANDVTGYKIYRYDTNTNTYKLIKTISDSSITSYKNTNLSSATRYLYKIKSYKIVDGKTYNSDYSSSLLATTKPLTPSIKLSTPSTKSIKLTLSNTSSRSTGYKIYMSTSKNGTYSYIGYTNSKTFTKIKLTKNKTYYFKVRAYRTVNGEKIYSSYSTIKSIKCK